MRCILRAASGLLAAAVALSSPGCARDRGGSSATAEGPRFSREGSAFVLHHPRYAVAAHPAHGIRFAAAQGPAISFGPAALARGAAALPPAGHAWIDRAGATRIARGEATEVLRASPQGVEQSWHFPRPPRGADDLTVRIPVAGFDYDGASAQDGLRFRHALTGAVAHYGAAFWVEADGRRHRLEGQWTGGDILLTVPSRLVDGSRYPAVLDPLISAEIPVSAPSSGPADGYPERYAVASDGTHHLVVWNDSRAGDHNVYAMRVSGTGQALDATSLPIATGAMNQFHPDVAFNGTHYLVIWVDRQGTTRTLYAARVTSAGVVLDPQGIVVAQAPFLLRPQLAWNGTHFLVTWSQSLISNFSNDYDIYGIRLDANGAAVDSAPFAISAAPSVAELYASVASAGGDFLVVWEDRRNGNEDVFAARVSAAGAVLDPAGLAVATSSRTERVPKVAAHPTGYLVVWQEHLNSGVSDIHGARLGLTGAVQGTLVVTSAKDHQQEPAVTFDGTQFLVAWQEYPSGDLFGGRVSPAGAILATNLPLATQPSEEQSPAVGSGGGAFLLVWRDWQAPVHTLRAHRLSSTGAVLDPVPTTVNLSGGHQIRPAVAYGVGQYLLAWSERRSATSYDILAVRMSDTGVILDSAPIVVSQAAGAQLEVVAAAGGADFLVVWTDHRNATPDIYAARLTGSGAVLDPNGIAVSTASNDQHQPAVAFGGGTWLVAWRDHRKDSQSAYRGDIVATRVSTGGVVSDPTGISITNDNVSQHWPAISWAGSSFLVAWGDWRNHDSGTGMFVYSDIYGARIDANGVRVDALDLPLSSTSADETRPQLAGRAGDFLITWWSNAPPQWGLTSRLMDATSAALTLPVKLSAGGLDPRQHSVVTDGTGFLAAWENIPYDSSFNNPGVVPDILARRVGSTGAVVDAVPFPVSAAAHGEFAPAAASRAAGEYLVGYSRFDAAAAVGAQRVVARQVSPSAAGGAGSPCASAAECASGFCVDQVCCNSACGGGATGDCLACSVAAGAAVNGTCGTATAGTFCRASQGSCDLAEACNGTSQSCPADQQAPATTVCRAAVGPCDLAESCTGTSAQCPADGFAPATTVCRAATGSCDAAESCTGASPACPPDLAMAAGTVCRAASAPCDAVEVCDGQSSSCPVDAVAAAGVECRPSAGDCDVLEACDGQASSCPPDVFASAGTGCRPAAGACDVGESCTGTQPSCPADLFVAPGLECRPAAGACDLAESCSGAAADCPPDGRAGPEVVCRPARGGCDPAESCDGAQVDCPQDSLAGPELTCRAAAGPCDVPEVCSGTADECPPDLHAAADSACRPAAGPCDVAEVCSGNDVACPADAFAGADVVCRQPAGACDRAEACDGLAADCPADLKVARGEEGAPTCGRHACDGFGDDCSTLCSVEDGCTNVFTVGCHCSSAGGAALPALLALLGYLLRRRRNLAQPA